MRKEGAGREKKKIRSESLPHEAAQKRHHHFPPSFFLSNVAHFFPPFRYTCAGKYQHRSLRKSTFRLLSFPLSNSKISSAKFLRSIFRPGYLAKKEWVAILFQSLFSLSSSFLSFNLRSLLFFPRRRGRKRRRRRRRKSLQGRC